MSRIPDLYVEGRDDQWSILSLLEVNGIKLVKDEGPVNIKPTYSVSEMLDNLPTFVKAAQAARSPVGFVLDIDLDIESRWRSICSKFKKLNFDMPDNALGTDGVIIDMPAGRVGIWLMPDNQSHDGKLEDFLRTLIRDDDAILPKAKSFVGDVGRSISAKERYKNIDVEKAELSQHGFPFRIHLASHTELQSRRASCSLHRQLPQNSSTGSRMYIRSKFRTVGYALAHSALPGRLVLWGLDIDRRLWSQKYLPTLIQ